MKSLLSVKVNFFVYFPWPYDSLWLSSQGTLCYAGPECTEKGIELVSKTSLFFFFLERLLKVNLKETTCGHISVYRL